MEHLQKAGFLVSLCFILSVVCLLAEAGNDLGGGLRGLDTGDYTTPESVGAKLFLPAVLALGTPLKEETSIQDKFPEGCVSDGFNRCLQAPAAAVRDYLRTLAARLLAITRTEIDFEDKRLRNDLMKLGCLSVAIVDLVEVQATVGLFKQGVVSRIRIDKTLLSQFKGGCDDKLLPLTYHQHENAAHLLPRGQLNIKKVCGPQNTGGHHDPGFACGPLGGELCEHLKVPASSALQGTSMFTGEYQCNPDIYSKRPFACHAGDLSGKLGVGTNASPDSNRPDFRVMALDTHADSPCVASENSQSLVLHCHSTNSRLACAPFHRVETAGTEIPELLSELIRTARNAVPYSKTQNSLIASLVFVNEMEQRIVVLERAARIRNPDETEDNGDAGEP